MGHTVLNLLTYRRVLLVRILSGPKWQPLWKRDFWGRRSLHALGCRWAPQGIPPLVFKEVTQQKTQHSVDNERIVTIEISQQSNLFFRKLVCKLQSL